MSKKKAVVIISAIVLVLAAVFCFSAFGFSKVDIYPKESERVFVRKIKNENTFLNIFKPSAESLLETGDLIVFKDPKVFDTKFSQRENYCSRIVGLPGDIISIRSSKIFVNDEALDETYPVYFKFRISTDSPTDFNDLLSAYDVEILETINNSKACHFVASQEVADKISSETNILNIRKIVEQADQGNKDVFSYILGGLPWNKDNMGPFSVPEKGITIMLKPRSVGIYKKLIEAHEKNTLFHDAYNIEINGEKTTQYTVKNNYYFVVNDNRASLSDSRSFGFVPESLIVGKVIK